MDYVKQSELFKALAHPIRLRIVTGLLTHECHVDKMVANLKVPQSTVSQHLNVLRSKGIVEVRKEGVRTCYRVVNPFVKELINILS